MRIREVRKQRPVRPCGLLMTECYRFFAARAQHPHCWARGRSGADALDRRPQLAARLEDIGRIRASLERLFWPANGRLIVICALLSRSCEYERTFIGSVTASRHPV